MKKIYYISLFIAIGLIQACTPETDLLFEKSASERMSEALRNYQELLVSASEGWLVEYYPHSSRTYGGFNLFFQFTGEEVTVESDVDPTLLTVGKAASSYSLGEDMGPTLNFDTHNNVLNFFSDPALNVGGGNGYGLEGDYEFVFMSGDASEIILRGKKTKNTIRMTPMTAEGWKAYRDDVLAMREKMFAPSYNMTVNGKTITITKPLTGYNRFVVTYEDGDPEPVSTGMAYVITPEGIRFEEPLTIDGVEMWEFTYNDTSGQMESEDGKAVIAKIFPSIDDLFINTLTSTEWEPSVNSMGDIFLNAFYAMERALNTIGESMSFMSFGPSVENSLPSFTFATYDGTNVYDASVLLNVIIVDNSQGLIKIEVTTKYEKNGGWYVRNVPELKEFVMLFGGEYKVAFPNPLNDIKSITLTDPANATRTFILSK